MKDAGDYISREAVKEKLSPMLNDPDAIDFWEWQCSEIDDIPAADVRENVEAHWIEDRMEIVCSKCNTRFSDEIIFMNRNMENEPLKYCPNCGADMREES